MDCLILPVLKSCYTGSQHGYRRLTEDGFSDMEGPVTVVVGKEQRKFLVEAFVLEESPFRILIETAKRDKEKRVIFVDHVDAILFEHMLWLMYNDCSSLLKLNVKEIIDFYTQDW